MTLHSKTGRVSATAPFEFARSLDYLRWFQPLDVEQSVDEESCVRAFRLGGQTALCRVSNGGAADRPGVQYTLYSDRQIGPDFAAASARQLSSFLGLEDNLSEFYALAEDDAPFLPILKQLYGYHPVRFLSAYQAAAWAILSQRNRMTTAANMYRRLVTRFGHAIELEGRRYHAFPEPDEVAWARESDLVAIAPSLRRAEFLIDAARAFAVAPPDFLRLAEYSEAEAWLRGISGIGPWSARFVLLRGVGRTEAIPGEDRAILRAVSRVYAGGLEVTSEEVQRIAARYGPWQGYWAHYLRMAA